MMRLYILTFLTLIAIQGSKAQLASVVAPAHNLTGVSKNLASITIETDYSLDSSSVVMSSYGDDSTGGWSVKIHLLPKSMYDSLDGDISHIRRAAQRGSLVHVNDTTARLDIYSGSLRFETRYCVVVDGFRVVIDTNGTPDTVAVPQIVTEFETEQPPHFITSIEPSNGLFRCNDTLKIQFNRKVTTTNNGSGPLARFITYSAPTIRDSASVSWSEDTTSASMSLSTDSLTLFILTTGLSDSPKVLHLRPSIMTGDPKDTVSFHVEKHVVAALYLKPKPSSTSISLPPELAEFQGDIPTPFYAGDTITLSAPQTYDSLYFVRWECDSDTLINNVTTRTLTRAYSCSEIQRIDAHPVYSVKSKDTIQITVSGSAYGSVRVEGWVDSLGSNTYTVWRGNTNGLTLAAIPAANGLFVSWASTVYMPINGSLRSKVVFLPGVGYWQNGQFIPIDVNFDPKPTVTCQAHSLNVTLDGAQYSSTNPRDPFQPLDFATVVTNPNMGIVATGPYAAAGQRNDPNAFNQYVSVTVNDACHEIQCVVLDGQVIAGSWNTAAPLGPAWAGTINVATPNCNRKLEVYLREVTYLLTKEIVGLNGTLLDVPNNESIEASPAGRVVYEWKRSNGKAKYTKVIEYACNEVVTLTPTMVKTDFINKNKEMVGWNENFPFTYTAVIDVPKKKIRFTMDDDRIVQLQFEEDVFLATHLIVLTNNPVIFNEDEGPLEWTFAIDNSGQIADQQTLNRARVEFEGSNQNQLVSPIIRFNKTVNVAGVKSTLNEVGDALASARVHAKDYTNSRVDLNATRLYVEEIDVPNPKEAELFLRSKKAGALESLPAWCSGKFTLNWDAGIVSAEQQTLSNPGFTTLTIAPPLVSAELTRLEVLRDCGWDWASCCEWFCIVEDDPEILVISTSAFRTVSPVNGRAVSKVEEPVTAGVYDGMGEDEIKTPNQLIGHYEPLDNNGILFLNFQVLDEDKVFTKLVETLGKISDGLSDVTNEKLKDDKQYINLGISVVAAALADLIAGDGPDYVANLTPNDNNHTFGSNVWGGMSANASAEPTKSREHELRNDVFSLKYKITLKPR